MKNGYINFKKMRGVRNSAVALLLVSPSANFFYPQNGK